MHRLLFLAALFLAPLSVLADEEISRTVVRRQGQDGVHTYRIPGLATTRQGTLIAVFDNRHKNSADLPGDIDVGVCRSEDNGQTWQPMRTILDFDAAEPNSRGNGVGDPAVLVDREQGTIWVAALWSRGNRAWHGSGPGASPDETGQLVLTRSDDDGLTWSKPRNITAEIKGRDSKWRLFFNGRGAASNCEMARSCSPPSFATSKVRPIHASFTAPTTAKIGPCRSRQFPPRRRPARRRLRN